MAQRLSPSGAAAVFCECIRHLCVSWHPVLPLFARSFVSQSHCNGFAGGTVCSVQPFNKCVFSSFLSLDQHSHPSGSIAIDRDSEVYKMLQENQESHEPPRQSASFLVLQEILESEEKGKPSCPPSLGAPFLSSIPWAAYGGSE